MFFYASNSKEYQEVFTHPSFFAKLAKTIAK